MNLVPHIVRYYRSEWRAIVLRPYVALRLVTGLGWMISLRLRKMVLRSRMPDYPSTVRVAIAQLLHDTTKKEVPENAHVTNTLGSDCMGQVSFTLATGRFELALPTGWHNHFADSEDTEALHRWSWLIKDGYGFEDGLCLVQSWYQALGDSPTGAASESYTVAERLASIVLFMHKHHRGWSDLPIDLRNALRVMGRQLAVNLEYFPNNMTGNHVINNARGLLLLANLTADDALEAVAAKIFEASLADFITVDGVMREGSSHYHFVFLRWIAECAIFARDEPLRSMLIDWLDKLVAAGELFLVRRADGSIGIPLIGDVSPDIRPDDLMVYLAKLGAQIPAGTPRQLRSALTRLHKLLCNGVGTKDGVMYRAATGLLRAEANGWVLFLPVVPGGGAAEASHAHQDFAAPVLYYHGQEVLIDTGRPDYHLASTRRDFEGANGHSSLCVNGAPPVLTRRDRLLPSGYRRCRANVSHCYNGENLVITVRHDGFSRISRTPLFHRRTITLAATMCHVNDQLDGKGSFDISGQMVMPCDSAAVLAGKLWQADGKTDIVQLKPRMRRRSEHYGDDQTASEFQFSYQANLPVIVDVTIDFTGRSLERRGI